MNERRWIVLSTDPFHVTDGFGSLRISQSPGGCWDIYRYFNGERPTDKDAEPDYLHICDMAEFMEQLQGVLDVQRSVEAGDPQEPCPHEHVGAVDGVPYCQACLAVILRRRA